MKRPVGVKLLVVWYALAAMVGVLGGLVMITNAGGPSALPERTRLIGGTAMVVFGIIAAIVAKGLWQLRNWARLMLIVLTAVHFVSVVRSLILLVVNLANAASSILLWAMATFLVSLLAILVLVACYLCRPHVKQVFGTA